MLVEEHFGSQVTAWPGYGSKVLFYLVLELPKFKSRKGCPWWDAAQGTLPARNVVQGSSHTTEWHVPVW